MIRILIVEDDLSIARANERLIRRAVTSAVEVVTTALGEVAIAELAIGGYDLVVSDFNLGGEATGADVLAAAGSTPFLFLSSDERIEDRGVPWLSKPCAPSELRAAVLVLLDPPKIVIDVPFEDVLDVAGAA